MGSFESSHSLVVGIVEALINARRVEVHGLLLYEAGARTRC